MRVLRKIYFSYWLFHTLRSLALFISKDVETEMVLFPITGPSLKNQLTVLLIGSSSSPERYSFPQLLFCVSQSDENSVWRLLKKNFHVMYILSNCSLMEIELTRYWSQRPEAGMVNIAAPKEFLNKCLFYPPFSHWRNSTLRLRVGIWSFKIPLSSSNCLNQFSQNSSNNTDRPVREVI